MDARELIRRIFEMIDSGDYGPIDELIHEDYVDHGSPLGEIRGRDGFRQLADTFRNAFSDFHNEVDLVVVEGEMAAWRSRASGVHTGDLMGIPASGKQVSFEGYNFGRMQDGKAVEHWALIDTVALMTQLGVAAAPAGV